MEVKKAYKCLALNEKNSMIMDKGGEMEFVSDQVVKVCPCEKRILIAFRRQFEVKETKKDITKGYDFLLELDGEHLVHFDGDYTIDEVDPNDLDLEAEIDGDLLFCKYDDTSEGEVFWVEFLEAFKEIAFSYVDGEWDDYSVEVEDFAAEYKNYTQSHLFECIKPPKEKNNIFSLIKNDEKKRR
ncbi:MAG: hypothetical protein ACI4HI_12535 [Lachnospiraceae bacterium]